MEQFNNETIIEQAKTFAKTLASSREFQQFYAAQEQFHQDQEARALLETYQVKQHEFQAAQMKGSGVSGSAVAEIQQLSEKVQQNFTIMAWADAQQKVIRLIQDANQTISAAAGFDFGQTLSGNGAC